MPSISHPKHPSHYARRGAAIYAMVLLLAFSVVGAGLTLVTVQASERRILKNIAAAEQATILARAGAEWLMRTVEEDANWRSTLTSGVALTTTPDTGLSFEVGVTDADGSLSDDDTNKVTLTATGTYQGAKHTMSFTASPNAHNALTYAVVSLNNAGFEGGTTISGPVYAADWIWRYSGDPTISAGSYFESPTSGHIESVFVPADDQVPAMTAPSPDLSFYISRATTVSLTGTSGDRLRRANFTPTDNTQGTPNSDGIYYVHIGWSHISVRSLHVKGTLIIQGYGNNQVWFDRACWLESGPSGYPTLLFDAPGGQLNMGMPADSLDESDRGIDYNEDGDTTDLFSSSVQGLVWANASWVWFYGSAWTFKGCLIASWDVWVDDGVTIQSDSALASQLIPGFTDGVLHRVQGSIRTGAP